MMLLYIGVDSTNDEVYEFLDSVKAEKFFHPFSRKFCCVYGLLPSSKAEYYIEDEEDIKQLLNRLKTAS